MDYWDLVKIGEDEKIHRSIYADNTEHSLIISTGGIGCTLYWDINDKEFSAHLVQFHSCKYDDNYDNHYVWPMMCWLTTRMEKPELRWMNVFDLAHLDPNVMVKTMQEALKIMDYHWRDEDD